ncbi:hypothetical protein LBW87_19155 [Herbaspirillum seropedicae]|nr:hypothetical protein [Herbaspirillum sp. alder98]
MTLRDGESWVAFRRNKRPPIWGAGEIWMVRIDRERMPVGEPFMLIEQGEDPRLVLVGQRLFLFYVYVDRNAKGDIVGTTIALAELDCADNFSLLHHIKLPKSPLGGKSQDTPDNAMPGYEKNWVPFTINDDTIGILYSHAPWIVLELVIAGEPSDWHFGATHRAPGIEWGYGEIRGGSVPLAYGHDQFITFFHSSARTGGKKIYYGGACVFSREAPYTPSAFTRLPLTTSPFKSGSDKHGWHLGQPIIFPLGAAYRDETASFDILCSLDDAFICRYSISDEDLDRYMAPIERDPEILRVLSHRKTSADDPDRLLYTSVSRIPFQDELIRFVNAMEISGALWIDMSADDGELLAVLNNQFTHSLSLALSPASRQSRERTCAINRLVNVSVGDPAQFSATIETAHRQADGETWMRLDAREEAIDIDAGIALGLELQANLMISGVPHETMQALYNQYRQLPGYGAHTIASADQLMFLFIAPAQRAKYHWFI